MKPRLNSLAESQASRLEETWHHPYGEALWWQHHAVGMFFSGRDWEPSQDQGKDAQSKVQRSLMKSALEQVRTSARYESSPSNRTMTLSTQQDNAGVASEQVSECP